MSQENYEKINAETKEATLSKNKGDADNEKFSAVETENATLKSEDENLTVEKEKITADDKKPTANAQDYSADAESESDKSEPSKTQKILELNGRKFILVGTAHVSAQSIDEVKSAIEREMPDNVAIELDENRLKNMEDPESWKKMDIIKVLRKKMGFLMMANLILASYQKRMGQQTSVKPGDEMMAAIQKAKELNIPQTMVDRPIAVTLRRAWSKNNFFGKCKLLSVLIASAFSKEEASAKEIEDLKQSSEMDNMMNELSHYLPKVKEVLIDERDFYLASHIWECKGDKVLAVLGAGHLPGVVEHLKKIAAGEENTDCSKIQEVPKKSVGSKIASWIIPILIVAFIVLGFVYGGEQMGKQMLSSWLLWNGVLAGLGALIAGAHPLTILVSIVGAPFTSLCPFIGIGIVAGIVQAIVCKPKVSDMETLQNDASSLKGFYRNRILRTLLVFLLSSIGSSIGTFVAGASFVAAITKFFDKIVDSVNSLFVK